MAWFEQMYRALRRGISQAVEDPADPPQPPGPPHPLNVPGPFYVENGCCMACAVWENEAPGLLAWSDDGIGHCYVARQPETDAEFGQMRNATEVAELDCIRMRNCRPDWAANLRQAGLGEQIDR